MQINWRRGFFGGWCVLSLLWILFAGWNEYPTYSFSAFFATPSWSADDACWKQIAKWPDGTAMRVFSDTMDDYFDDPSSVEKEWGTYSMPQRKQWRQTIRQKLDDCARAKPIMPIMDRLELGLSDNWSVIKKSSLIILMPPLVLLIAGLFFVWVLKGFRARA